MIKKLLIANRGEIAVRIIRACQEMGIKTVAVHSTADEHSLHTKLADESVCIGPGPSAQSYLSIPAIMSAAELTGVDALHPGYGFLAENPQLAKVCKTYNIKFVGPNEQCIKSLGNKVDARNIAIKAGVPLLPGSTKAIETDKEAVALSKETGFPLIIKAAAGGGGRGMKIVRDPGDLSRALQQTRREAEVGFGNPDVFIEKYLDKPRHVEVQIAADQHGNVVALGERDCSVQRRHQKLIEEAPCSVFDQKLRNKIQEVAVKLCKTAGYDSMGTVEFLFDDASKEFYFMEVNTRIQVEHPVTELVTGRDLIKDMIRVADGEELGYKQSDVVLRGHAIECRVNAECPKSFAPWPGRLTQYHEPGGPGVRVDSMAYTDYVVPKHYDSMIAKIITYGSDRAEALARMRRALREMKIDGIRTNLSFHAEIIDHKDFVSGNISTHFLDPWVKKS